MAGTLANLPVVLVGPAFLVAHPPLDLVGGAFQEGGRACLHLVAHPPLGLAGGAFLPQVAGACNLVVSWGVEAEVCLLLEARAAPHHFRLEWRRMVRTQANLTPN